MALAITVVTITSSCANVKQDVIFAGGGEELHWQLAMEFDAMGALSTKYNDTPEKASRTYDANRDGSSENWSCSATA